MTCWFSSQNKNTSFFVVEITQVTSERERADQALVQLEEHSKQLQVKTSQILMLEAQTLELQTSTASPGSAGDRLRDEVSELRKNLADEKEKNENKCIQALELERELQQVKEQLEHTQQLEQFNEKLHQRHQVEELRKKLQEQEVMSQQTLDELRSKLECQERSSQEDGHGLGAKGDEQRQASETQLEELKCKLSEQQEASDKVVDDLRLKFSEQGKTAELLEAQLEEARSKVKGSSCSEEEVKRLNSELQTEVAALREKLSNIEETKAPLASSETETTPTEMDRRTDKRASAELQKKLLEKEVQVTALQKSLQEAVERREEEEIQAHQEARRREAERRRELLAVAHEAIAHKDEELEKKGGEISRLLFIFCFIYT